MFFSKRSLENPRTPINSETLDLYFNGPETAAGVQVNEQSGLRLSAVWACIRILAESIASLPFHVYEINADGTRGRVNNLRQSDLLGMVPNDEMTPAVWKETIQGHLGGWGNGYAYVSRDRAGRPRETFPLLPDTTTPRRDEAGNLIYETVIDGTMYRMRPRDVIHIPGLGYDGLVGYSPIQIHRQNIGLGLAAEEYGARFFGGDATVQGVIELPTALSDTTSLESSWRRAHGGLKNKHQIAVLEQGAKYNKVGIPPNDAQFIETRKYQATEIARIYRIPPHMIADLERATFTNIEHQSLEFVKYTLTPWLVKWEQELTRKLFTGPEQRRFYVKINVEGLLRGDTESRYKSYETARNTGWLNVNEIRDKEDMNGIGEEGDEYLLTPPGNTNVNNDNGSEDDGEENSRNITVPIEPDYEKVLEPFKKDLAKLEDKLAERVLAKEINSVRNAYTKGGIDKVEQWYNDNLEKMVGYITDVFEVSAEACRGYLASSFDQFQDSETIEEWASSRSTDLLCVIKLAGEK